PITATRTGWSLTAGLLSIHDGHIDMRGRGPNLRRGQTTGEPRHAGTGPDRVSRWVGLPDAGTDVGLYSTQARENGGPVRARRASPVARSAARLGPRPASPPPLIARR